MSSSNSMMGSITFAEYGPIACRQPHGPGRMILISSFVIFHESVGTENGGSRAFGVAGHLVEAEIPASILPYNIPLDVVIPEPPPAVLHIRARSPDPAPHLR